MIQIFVILVIVMKVLVIMIDVFDVPQYMINNFLGRYWTDTREHRLILYTFIFITLTIIYLKFF